MRQEQLVDVARVDPEQDQALIERQGSAQRLEHRTIEADQGEALEPLLTKRLQRQRAMVLDRPQGRAEVGGPVFEADQAQDRPGFAQRGFVALEALGELAIPTGSARTSGSAAGYRAASLRSGGVSSASSVTRMLRSVSSARLSPKYSRQWSRTSAAAASFTDVAQAAKLLGMLLVEVDRLEIEPVEEPEPPQSVGPVDRHRILAKSIGNPGHQETLLSSSLRIALGKINQRILCAADTHLPRRGGVRLALTPGGGQTRLERQFGQHSQHGQQDDKGKQSLHRMGRPGIGGVLSDGSTTGPRRCVAEGLHPLHHAVTPRRRPAVAVETASHPSRRDIV